MDKTNREKKKTYSYKTRKDRIRLRIVDGPEEKQMFDDNRQMLDGNHKILDGMDSICKSKGEEAVRRAEYYNSYDLKATDPQGMYTGIPINTFGEVPVQDVDDL